MTKKLKYLLFAIICMCVTPLITRAECDYQRQAELSKLASNVQMSSSYQMVGNFPEFTITLTNLTNDIYVVDNFGKNFSGKAEISAPYKEGNNVEFTFYSNDANCRGEEIVTRYVNLPNFNPRYNTPDCKTYPDFSLCQMWVDTSFTPEQFASELEKYKQRISASMSQNVESYGSIFDVVFSFLSNNVFIFVIIGIVILISACVLLYRKFRYRR